MIPKQLNRKANPFTVKMLKIAAFSCCLFFFSPSSFAYTDDELKKEVKYLLERINSEHVKPKSLDESFASLVNDIFLSYLDPEKIIFNRQDESDFSAKKATLLADLKNGTLDYFKLVRERFDTRVNAFAEKGKLSYASANPTTTLTKNLPKFGKDRPEVNQQSTYWENYFAETYFGEMMGMLKENEQDFPKDSLNVWSDRVKKNLAKRTESVSHDWKDNDQLGIIFLNAIAQAFDPHTYFFTNKSKNDFEEELTPEREIYGISLVFDLNNKTLVSSIAPGSPAWLSNEIHVNDEVLELSFKDGKVFDFNGSKQVFRDAIDYFDIAKTKEIDLTLKSGDNPAKTVHLIKAKVYSDDDIIKNALLTGEKNIGYVALPDFYVNWTDTSQLGCANDLAKCLIKLKKDNIEGLILDLRGNGGGSLKEAIDVAGIFIDYGPILAVKEKDNEVHVLKDLNRGAIYTGPLLIMVDERSASASEIVASTLQDYNRAVIFGTSSFGKATSQAIFPIDPSINELSGLLFKEDESLGYANITLGELYRVNGSTNQLRGVQPDIPWKLNLMDNESEKESNYKSAIVPDSINKKINYTPGKKADILSLGMNSEQRLGAQATFTEYAKLISRFNELAKSSSVVAGNLHSQLAERNKLLKLMEEFAAFEKQLICNFEASTNHFDRDLIASDEVLNMYNRLFLESLKKDVELMESVNIMMDIIKNHE